MKTTCTEILVVKAEGTGGPYQESLSSLVIRLAAENNVSPARLLEGKFAPGMSNAGLWLTCRAMGPWVGQALNGNSDTTRSFVRQVESLTALKNLQAATTLGFSKFTTMNGLLRKTLAWSPTVLRECPKPYYPLLWALEAARVCPETKRPLVTLCPHCREPMRPMTGGARIGRCYKCGNDLCVEKQGSCSGDRVVSSVRHLDYEVWVSRQLASYVKYQADHQLPDSFDFPAVLKFWLEKFGLPLSSSSGQLLGRSQNALAGWIRRDSLPRVRATLNLCWVFGVSLIEFLTCQVPAKHDGRLRKSMDWQERTISTSGRRPIDKFELEQQLLTIIRENRFAMLSFSEICKKKLKRGDIVVRQYHPELARTISKRYLENRRLLGEMQRQQFCAAIRTAAQFLHGRGIVPNHKTLSNLLSQPGKLRCQWAIEYLTQVRAELGYEEVGEQLLLAV